LVSLEVIHAYFGYTIVAIQKQLGGTASVIKDVSGKSTSLPDFTHCINNAILCSGSNDVDHISEVLNRLDR
jgi:hypothetical protein